jgi:proline iminopeptidase
MSTNTTGHLLRDMEQLREHLGVDRWLLWGGSWGATLALAYAERHPDRVSEIVLVSVTMGRRADIDWLYRGAGRFFPEAWARFRDAVDAGDYRLPTDSQPAIEGLLSAYAERMGDADREVRERAAAEWCAWEDAPISLEINGQPGAYSARLDDARLAFVRICAHYFSQGAFLAEGAILDDASRLAGIPGVLIHGRQDLGGPAVVAWELARAWPDAELRIIDDSGHTGSDAMARTMLAALDRFART